MRRAEGMCRRESDAAALLPSTDAYIEKALLSWRFIAGEGGAV